MKNWPANHPRADLIARKRAAIVAAARNAFLRTGYEGTSMEAIATAADVSIMTLYRHAVSKDLLFAAVIASACDPHDEAEQTEFPRLMKKPLRDILVTVGIMAQRRLADPATVALMRTVMAETVRFPQLGDTAYRGLVGRLEDMVDYILAQKEEAAELTDSARRRLAALFIDRLFGSDMLRVLLGLTGLSTTYQKHRAEHARDEVLRELTLSSRSPSV